MRAFIVVCIFAAASAASLGYDYGQVSDYGSSAYDGVPINRYNPNQGVPNSPIGSSDFSAPPVGPAEFEKQYFTFSAPEDEFDAKTDPLLNNDLRRGLRIIFIKGPENAGLEKAALKLAQSAAEQRTAIYVLSRQADIADLANKLNALNTNNANKPEVHFVKYRTPADAENAQSAIQNHYDGLDGKSSNHDAGVAAVLNFASRAPASNNSGGHASAQPATAYLPVSGFV